MAMIKCHECGKEISSKAEVCPHCGAKPKKKTSLFTWLVILGVLLYIAIPDKKENTPSTKQEPSVQKLTVEEKQALEKKLLKELKTIPAEQYSENLSRYKRLSDMFPNNNMYNKKKNHYQTLVDKEEAKRRVQQQRADNIKKQFSAWDGSHYNLERLVKKNLKDPDSYEHMETRYMDNGDYLTVLMRYRAKNSFGGYTIGNVVAKTDINTGQILEIVSSN